MSVAATERTGPGVGGFLFNTKYPHTSITNTSNDLFTDDLFDMSGALLPFRFSSQADSARPTLLDPKSLHNSNTKLSKDADVARSRRASTPVISARFAGEPRASALANRGKSKEADWDLGKAKGKTSVDSSNGPESDAFDADPFSMNYNASTSSTSYDTAPHLTRPGSSNAQSRPSTANTSVVQPSASSPSLLKRTRGSFFGAASDALGGFKFGKRRPKTLSYTNPIRQQFSTQVILPDVIEISAPPRDEEVEYREKLKEEAARAILGSAFLSPSNGENRERGDGNEAVEDEEGRPPDEDAADVDGHRDSEEVLSISFDQRSLALSLSNPLGRHQPGSPMTHSRNNSSAFASIPPFPATSAALSQFLQDSSTVPKYYPPSSLRIFALSKHWKPRFIILSSPALFSPSSFSSTRSSPAPSYLHLFKSSGAEEKELERLEINEHSVVYVAEEEVGGRGHVVKVGGLDVGALKKELNYEEGGRTLWLLQITDPAESQRWITAIKNAILGQRTVRAGLPLHSAQTLLSNEPRGDMDVMFTMRTQNHATSPRSTVDSPLRSLHSPLLSPTFASPTGTSASTPITPPASGTFAPSFPPTDPDPSRKGTHASRQSNPNYASSVSSQSVRSQATAPKPPSAHLSIGPGAAVSALKGLFTRPRSPSRATASSSFELDREERNAVPIVVDEQDEHVEESFASAGSNLLGMLKPGETSNQVARSGSVTPGVTPKLPTLSFSNPSSPALETTQLERKIVVTPQSNGWPVEEGTVKLISSKDRTHKALSLNALSLQPPPRKRWTGVSPSDEAREQNGIYQHVNGNNSVAGSFGLLVPHHERTPTQPQPMSTSSGSPTINGHSPLGTPEQRPRAPSIQSVSTFASGDVPLERSNSSAKRNSTAKRWSRQGNLLPQPPAPAVPPPAIPVARSRSSTSTSSSPQISRRSHHPYAAPSGRPLSGTSDRSNASDKSVVSGLPNFSKRASTSSAISTNTSSSASPVHAYANPFSGSLSRLTSSHRASMPPPRPAPTTALPPAPDQDPHRSEPVSPTTPTHPHKSSFRESMANRAFRLSLMAPKPPPMSVLPPRPDEVRPPPSKGSHRRTASAGNSRRSSELYAIISAPLHNPQGPRFPPPSGPLPPTPTNPTSAPTRTASLKQRLRILSTPSHPQAQTPLSNSSTPNLADHSTPYTDSNFYPPQPATPIAEKITHLQNDPSFLQMYTPSMSSLPTPKIRNVSPPPDIFSEVTSLSPPPRRSSKQISVFDHPSEGPEPSPTIPEGLAVDVDPKPLERRGSVISLGIVTM